MKKSKRFPELGHCILYGYIRKVDLGLKHFTSLLADIHKQFLFLKQVSRKNWPFETLVHLIYMYGMVNKHISIEIYIYTYLLNPLHCKL